MNKTAKPQEVLEFLKKAHDDFRPFFGQILFNKRHPLHRTIVALYSSILELTGACILLTDSRLIAGVPILLRAALEAYVDLVNLIRDPRYGYNLELAYLKEWLKLLEEAKNGKNEYLADIGNAPNLDATIVQWREETRKLKENGFKALLIESKFKSAGMDKEYRSIYNSLCSDAHNNIRALVERHIERERGDFSVVVYKVYTPEDSAVYVGTGAELLMNATQHVHEFFRSKVLHELPAYRAELDRIHGGASVARMKREWNPG